MKVSVIVPCYHGNQYLHSLLPMIRKCASGFAAEGGTTELVLVNDSPEIPLRYEDCSFDGFTIKELVNEKNLGIQKSRVRGIRAASGDGIILLDQDDKLTENAIISQVKHFENVDFVLANGWYEDENKKKHIIFTSDRQHKMALKLRTYFEFTDPVKSPGQLLIRKSSFPMEYAQNILQYNGADDAYLMMLLLNGSREGVINPDVLYGHVHTGTNASLDYSRMQKSELEIVQYVKKFTDFYERRIYIRRVQYLHLSDQEKTLKQKIRYLDVRMILFVYKHFLYGMK